MKSEIIYEDPYLLVVYKPAGLATQTAKIGQPDLVSEIKNYYKNSYLGVIHRLDQPVEGLLVMARDQKTAADLTRQLTVGSLNKRYYAVVCGKPEQLEDKLVDNLYQDGNRKTQIVDAVQSSDNNLKLQKAVLRYQLKETLSTPELISLMDIHIETGRFHQIRAQMAHAGLPLLGDSKYGTEQSQELSRRLGVRNVALCASEICFRHPANGKACTYTVLPRARIFADFTEPKA